MFRKIIQVKHMNKQPDHQTYQYLRWELAEHTELD